MAGVANPSVKLHREHPRPLRPVAHEPKEGNDPVQFCTGVAGLSDRLSGTLSQCRSHTMDDLGLRSHAVAAKGLWFRRGVDGVRAEPAVVGLFRSLAG